MHDIGKSFAKLNLGKTINKPVIHKIEYIHYDQNDACKCTDSLPLDSIRYKLPDMGKYECYYISDVLGENKYFISYCGSYACQVYGKLLFYDKYTKSAKILPVYSESWGDQHVSHGYFCIVKNKTIEIFKGSCYDDGCSLRNSYSITVLENGEIRIKENK